MQGSWHVVLRAWRLAACGARCWLALHSTSIKEATPALVDKVVPNTNSPQPLMLKDRSGVLHVRFTDIPVALFYNSTEKVSLPFATPRQFLKPHPDE